MTTQPSTELRDEAEQFQQDIADELDARIGEQQAEGETGDSENGPTIDIVVDGRTLDDAEVEALLQKPTYELTDAEREGLQPLFEAAGVQQRQGVDPVALATDLLTEAAAALLRKPPAAGQRLEHKIALGQAIATLVQAQATRQLAMLTQQQLQLVVHAQQAQLAKAAGPAGIVIPQAANVRLHG